MDLNQLNTALATHAHRRDPGSLSAPGLRDCPGTDPALDAKALKERDDHRAPRVAYDDLFESLDDEMASNGPSCLGAEYWRDSARRQEPSASQSGQRVNSR